MKGYNTAIMCTTWLTQSGNLYKQINRKTHKPVWPPVCGTQEAQQLITQQQKKKKRLVLVQQ